MVAGADTSILVGEVKPASVEICSSYFKNVVPAGTLELLQSRSGVRLEVTALLAGEIRFGMLGGLAVVIVCIADQALGPFVPLDWTRQYRVVPAGRSAVGVYVEGVTTVFVTVLVKPALLEIWIL